MHDFCTISAKLIPRRPPHETQRPASSSSSSSSCPRPPPLPWRGRGGRTRRGGGQRSEKSILLGDFWELGRVFLKKNSWYQRPNADSYTRAHGQRCDAAADGGPWAGRLMLWIEYEKNVLKNDTKRFVSYWSFIVTNKSGGNCGCSSSNTSATAAATTLATATWVTTTPAATTIMATAALQQNRVQQQHACYWCFCCCCWSTGSNTKKRVYTQSQLHPPAGVDALPGHCVRLDAEALTEQEEEAEGGGKKRPIWRMELE